MNEKNILKERYVNYSNMDKREGDYYLEILNNCKDICDSEQVINGQNKCKIVTATIIKKDAQWLTFNCALTLGDEARTIYGDIYTKKNSVIVDMHVERILAHDERSIYTVLDRFEIKDDKVTRKSYYNYNMQETKERIK